LVERLTDPDILLFSSNFICKPQGDGRRRPWHEDSAYWKKRLDHPKRWSESSLADHAFSYEDPAEACKTHGIKPH